MNYEKALKLKCDIFSKGVVCDLTLLRNLENLASRDYATTRGLSLVINDKYYINAPVLEKFAEKSNIHIKIINNIYHIESNSELVDVKLLHNPTYYDFKSSSGIKFTDFINTHTDRARINPVSGCSMKCKFCDTPFTEKYKLNTIDQINEGVKKAVLDKMKPARHVLLSGGTPLARDEAYIDALFEKVISTSSVPVDIMMSPRSDASHPAYLKDIGINDLFINLEGADQTKLQTIAPEKFKLGIANYVKYIENAVKILGAGRVMSLVIVGLEEFNYTIQAVKSLLSVGCIPVLSPFRPGLYTPFKRNIPPSTEFLLDCYCICNEIAKEHKLYLGPKCIPCMHNTLTIPDDSGNYFFY